MTQVKQRKSGEWAEQSIQELRNDLSLALLKPKSYNEEKERMRQKEELKRYSLKFSKNKRQ